MVPKMNKRGRSFFIKSQQISNLSGTVLVLFTTVRDRVQFRLWKHTFLFLETWNTTCFCWIREHPPLLKDLLWFPCVLFALSVSLTADGFVILFPSRFLCYITKKKTEYIRKIVQSRSQRFSSTRKARERDHGNEDDHIAKTETKLTRSTLDKTG